MIAPGTGLASNYLTALRPNLTTLVFIQKNPPVFTSPVHYQT